MSREYWTFPAPVQESRKLYWTLPQNIWGFVMKEALERKQSLLKLEELIK